MTNRTMSGQNTISGHLVFKLRDEIGFPLVFVFDFCEQNELTVRWDEFIESAMKVWKVKKVLAEIEGTLNEAGWRGERFDAFMERVRLYIDLSIDKDRN